MDPITILKAVMLAQALIQEIMAALAAGGDANTVIEISHLGWRSEISAQQLENAVQP